LQRADERRRPRHGGARGSACPPARRTAVRLDRAPARVGGLLARGRLRRRRLPASETARGARRRPRLRERAPAARDVVAVPRRRGPPVRDAARAETRVDAALEPRADVPLSAGGQAVTYGRHWESRAEQWAAWARAPGHDAFWSESGPPFFELVPAAGRATLDVGCGEGRVARDLKRRGHAVVGIDSAPTLVRLAREADPGGEYVVADAAALPFADGNFD